MARTTDEVVIVNSNGDVVNPATEETLQVLVDEGTPKAIKLDDTSTTNVTYVGLADTGSLGSNAVWRIFKIDETSGLVITYADGNSSFDNVWDNRVSLTYS